MEKDLNIDEKQIPDEEIENISGGGGLAANPVVVKSGFLPPASDGGFVGTAPAAYPFGVGSELNSPDRKSIIIHATAGTGEKMRTNAGTDKAKPAYH